MSMTETDNYYTGWTVDGICVENGTESFLCDSPVDAQDAVAILNSLGNSILGYREELARLRAALAEEQAVVAALRERLSVVAADARWERRHDGPPPAPDRDMSYADMLRYAQGDFDHEAESIREQHRKEASDVR